MIGKRVIVANQGKVSAVVEEKVAPNYEFKSVSGFNAAVLWGTSAHAEIPWNGADSANIVGSILPEIGETRLLVVTFPPDSVLAEPGFDPAAAGIEYLERLPGLAEAFERENPGMHTTQTIDYDIVLNGEIILELDDGASVLLKQGDVVIQHGTRHAWRNRSAKPATLAFVLIGAKKQST